MTGPAPLYFDANATTPLHPAVLEEMLPYLKEEFGNPSSIHAWGQRAKNGLDEARFRMAAFLGCRTTEVVFTSSGTEANNLAILGLLSHLAETRGTSLNRLDGHIVTTMIEHSSVLEPLRWLEGWGIEITRVPAGKEGSVSAEDLLTALRPNTVLAAVMLVNNETGVIQPIDEISAELNRKKIPLLIDAVQAAGKIRVNPDELGADFLCLAAHKAEGPKGSGVLYLRGGRKISPVTRGGSQDAKLRGGTHNVPAIVGCGAAFARLDNFAAGSAAGSDHPKARLRNRFEETLLLGAEAVVNGAGADRVWNTANLSFPGVSGEALLARLDMEGLAASRGSACASGVVKASHVLSSMGIERDLVNSAVRFSFLPSVTESEIDRGAEIVKSCVKELRKN